MTLTPLIIAHHRIGGYIDGEHASQLLDPIHDPGPAVVVVFPRMSVLATQKGTPDAAVHHVIPRGVGEGNEG